MRQLKLFLLVCIVCTFFNAQKTQAQVSVTDSIELLEFGRAFGGLTIANTPIATSWNSTTYLNAAELWDPSSPISEWYGVTTIDSMNTGVLKVFGIDLSGLPLVNGMGLMSMDFTEMEVFRLDSCGLSGILNSTSFFTSTLFNLRILSLNDNDFIFDKSFLIDITSPLFSLEQVNLRNSYNPSNISTFDSSFFSFFASNLKILDISENDFFGNLDFDMGGFSGLANLEELYVANNEFSSISFPANSNLRVLNISNNQLDDVIYLKNVLDSAALLSVLEAMNALDTLGNTYNFNTAPGEFVASSQTNIRVNLSSNKLDGFIDLDYFLDVALVTELFLGYNEIDTFNGPSNANQFLKQLKLYHNEIEQKFPAEIFNNLRGIEVLYMNDNKFHGNLPPFNSASFEFLKRLHLQNNEKLTGRIVLEDMLGDQDAGNAPFEELDLSNNEFYDIEVFAPGTVNFLNFRTLKLAGNKFHFDDLFNAVRTFTMEPASVFVAQTGGNVPHYIAPYWDSGAGQGISFDTLEYFTYFPQDSAGIGGVRRRPQGDSVYFRTNVGFDPDIVNNVVWYRDSSTVTEIVGGVIPTNTTGGVNTGTVTSTMTAPGATVSPFNIPDVVRIENLDSNLHANWLYYANVEHDSFPLLNIPVRPKKLVIGECFDATGAPTQCQQIVIQFKPGTTNEDKERVREEFGIEVIDSCVCGEIELWNLPDTLNQADVEAFGFGTRSAATQADSRTELLSADQNYKLLDGGMNVAKRAPNFNQGSTNPSPTLVAIVDSGVDFDNPKIRDRMWVNSLDANNNGTDDDNDCEIDNGWGWNYLDRNNITYDDHGHGTVLASIIGGYGSVNVMPNTTSMDDIAIIPYKYTDGKGSGTVYEAACAVRHAADYADPTTGGQTAQVRVINTSWGYYGAPCMVLENAIVYAGDQCGILVVASAGNGKPTGTGVDVGLDNNKHWPSNSPFAFDSLGINDNVISVAAHPPGNPDILASYSNYSDVHIDIVANGFTETYVTGSDTNTIAANNGTSFATGQVTRAAALLFHEFPQASYGAVKNALMLGVDTLLTLDAGKIVSRGRLNYQKARDILRNTLNPSFCADDGFIVSVDKIAGDVQEDLVDRVYPNPFNNELVIQLNDKANSSLEPVNIELWTVEGKQVYQYTTAAQSQLQVQTNNLPAGMYLLKVHQNGVIQVLKVMKM